MPSIISRRRVTKPSLRKRSYSPRMESLENRLTLTASLSVVATQPYAQAGAIEVVGGPVVDSSGNLFTAADAFSQGDALGYILRTDAKTHATTIQATFSQAAGDGTPLTQIVIDSGGNIFGTAGGGGKNGVGSIFEVGAGSGSVQTIASLDFSTTGTKPGDLLLAPDGTLYDATASGGANGDGAVFSVNGGPAFNILDSFNGTNGQAATGGLALSDGVLYGTTSLGGALGGGTIFSIQATGGTITPLGSFKPSGFNTTASPHLAVLKGFVYGTTAVDPSSINGSVFDVPIGGIGASMTVPTSPLTMGSHPTGLINDHGTLVGVTAGGGPTNHGTIYTVDPTTLRVTTPIDFNDANSPNTGGAPTGVSFKDIAGNLYGASFEGGAASGVTILWKLSGIAPPPIAIIAGPTGGLVGTPLSPVSVALSDFAPGAVVSLSLGTGPAGGALSPPTSYAAVDGNGVATFTGLSVNVPGTYTLVAKSGSFTSDPFGVSVSMGVVTIPPAPTTFHWSGGGPDANWSDAKNWQEGIAPVAGTIESLVFPAGAANTTNVDDIFNLEVGNFQIATNYIMSGSDPLTLAGPLTFQAASGGCIVGLPLILAGNETVIVGDGNTLLLTSTIDGSGVLTIPGPGTLALPAGHTYSGGTVITGGTVLVSDNQALGTGPVVCQGGAIDKGVSGALIISNPLVISGNVTLNRDTLRGDSITYSGPVVVTQTSVVSGGFDPDGTPIGEIGFSGAPIVVGPNQQLAISTSVTFDHSSITGHVILSAYRSISSLIDVVLAPGATLDVLNANQVAVDGTPSALSGNGTFNVSGTLFVHDPSPNYQGTVNLENRSLAALFAKSDLGTGRLNLFMGSTLLAEDNQASVTLANSQTMMSTGVTFLVRGGQTLVFQNNVVISPNTAVELDGGTLVFDSIQFNGKATLTVSGSGVVKVQSQSMAKHIHEAHGSHVKIEVLAKQGKGKKKGK